MVYGPNCGKLYISVKMAEVKSDKVKSGELKDTCELCEEMGGCRHGKEVMTKLFQN